MAAKSNQQFVVYPATQTIYFDKERTRGVTITNIFRVPAGHGIPLFRKAMLNALQRLEVVAAEAKPFGFDREPIPPEAKQERALVELQMQLEKMTGKQSKPRKVKP